MAKKTRTTNNSMIEDINKDSEITLENDPVVFELNMEPVQSAFKCENDVKEITNEVETFSFSEKMTNLYLGVYPIADDVLLPRYETEGSAGFDLRAYIPEGMSITGYDINNTKFEVKSKNILVGEDGYKVGVVINPGDVLLIPTGLHFDIPFGFKMDIRPRSGISVKKKLNIINCIGLVDEDYVDQVYITLFNNSKKREFIEDGTRLVQAEIVPYTQFDFKQLNTKPIQKTSRSGGFGHTGVK